MVKLVRAFFLALTILAFLLFSTIGTTTVYADDGSETETPETETTEEAPPADEEAPVVEDEQAEENPVTDVEQPTGDEEPPVDETEVPAEESVEEATTEEPTQTILEQVPENTTVTVLNSEGETLPLASQESAEAIYSDYDPIWCPAGQVPTPGENGCTQSFSSFDELLTFLQTNETDTAYQQAGTIYIQQGDYLGGESEIDFNDYNFNQINNFDLTLQGGWDTTFDPDVNGDPTFTSTSFDVPIIIGSSTNPWAGSLTLNNISISGVTSQTGLTLHTTSTIDLEQVEVTNSQAGMDLNAGDEISLLDVNASNNQDYGARIQGDQVAIDTANFSNNGSAAGPNGYGLSVESLSLVALISVTADNNQTIGANIFAGDLVAIAQSAFRQNGEIGLNVETPGIIALNLVTADGNHEFGADLQGGEISVENSSFSNNGSGVETNPTGSGLMIVSSDDVTLFNVTANDNQFYGADIQAQGFVFIQNAFFSGHQSVLPEGVDNDVCSGYQVEVADWVDFDFCGYGLKVVTPGDIFLDGVTGNFNNLWGAWLDGNNVSVYNSQFNNNVTNSRTFVDDTGMLIFASGLVDIFRTEARENRLYGALIEAEGPVFITESFFTGNQGFICLDMWCNAREHFGVGLVVTTPDSIFMWDTDVSDNNLFGAVLNGSQVVIENSTFNNNSMGDGLHINATGDVTLTGVTAVNNAGDGVEVNGITCDQVVHVTGGTFTDNLLYGLAVHNATLIHDGTQVFANNGSGDFFNDTCAIILDPSFNIGDQSAPPVDTSVNVTTSNTITNGVQSASTILVKLTNQVSTYESTLRKSNGMWFGRLVKLGRNAGLNDTTMLKYMQCMHLIY
jgi:hypothetical protein